jgi:hypothetical protein
LTEEFPTLLLSRRPRQPGVDWFGARSWLGGAPRLGATPWPRDKSGEPLHFAAQIDLAEVARATGGVPLPANGSLAFFIGREGAVIFVPEGQAKTVYPPAGTPDLTKFGGSIDWPYDLEGRPLYPYWPVCFSVLDLAPAPENPQDSDYDERVEAFRAAQAAAVEKHLPRRKYNLSPGQAFAGPPIPDWWQNAIQLSSDLARASRDGQGALNLWRMKLEQARAKGGQELADAEAVVAKLEAELAKLHEAQPAFKDYVAEVAEWTAERDPWALMSAEEMAQLRVYWKRNTAFPNLTGYRGIGELDWLKEKMLKALPAAGSAEYAGLPAQVRSLIDAHRAPRPMWWHSATAFAKGLGEAMRVGVPRASKSEREKLEVDRGLLAALRPRGPFAGLRRMVDGKGKGAAEIEARIAANEAKLAERRTAEIAFKTFVDETTAWVESRDPWALMATADIERLKAKLARAEKEFRDFVRYIVPTRIEDLETRTLRAMITGPDRAYAALPEKVRNLANRDYLLPPGVWHQMFGWGVEIQDDSRAMREQGNIMLLQLTYDDLMHWSFGDNGVYQFWIAPEDLIRQNWSAVKMTFECH